MENKTVLIIDDQDDLRFILSFDLKKKGYQAIQAKNGKEGIDLAKKSMPGIILLDRKMPEMDGLETCRKIKEDESIKHIPVLMVSGKAQKDELHQAVEAGAAGYIIKPFKFDELFKKIQEIMRGES